MTTTQIFTVPPRPKVLRNSRRNRSSKIADSIKQRLRIPRSLLLISVAQQDIFAERSKWPQRNIRKVFRHDALQQKVPLTLIISPSVQATLKRMSGSHRSSSGAGSQSPRSRGQASPTEDAGSTGATSGTPRGRERLAIGFLAGTQPVQHSSSSGSSSGHGYLQGSHRGTSATPTNPGRRFTHTPTVGFSAAGAFTREAIPASPPDARGRTYHLEVVQHPERSAEFGSAALSRLPLSPPPIVQLTIRDQAGSPINPNTELPFLVAHLHLHAEDGTPLDMETTGQSMLYGSTVSSAQTLRNLLGSMGSFFVFPDVSISIRGRYILRITLMRLPRIGLPTPANSANSAGTLATAYTRPFDIVSQTNYAAPQPTQLTQYFIRQGARMANNGL